MARPMIEKIDQVAVVVKDAKATVRYLVEQFGIGPWSHLQFGDDGVTDIRFGSIADCVTEGDPIGTYSIDCCCCDMPNGVQLEVISPKTGSSIFARYLKRHGPGVQHISIKLTQSYEEALARMAKAGFSQGQFATVIRDETCAFIDHTKVLGTYLEVHKRPQNWGKPREEEIDFTFFPGPTPEDLPARPPVFRQLDELDIVVCDLDLSLDTLENEYGLGPWTRSETDSQRRAKCTALNLTLSLVQPKRADSPEGKFLAVHGPDILGFTAELANPPGPKVQVQREGEVLRIPDDGTLGAELLLGTSCRL